MQLKDKQMKYIEIWSISNYLILRHVKAKCFTIEIHSKNLKCTVKVESTVKVIDRSYKVKVYQMKGHM